VLDRAWARRETLGRGALLSIEGPPVGRGEPDKRTNGRAF
jgi:hypothetical protein